MKVSEAMHRGTNWVSPDENIRDLAQKMRKDDVGALPVGENDRLVGMVTDRDIALRAFDGSADPLQLKARDVMTKPIVYCTAHQELEEAVRIMEVKRVRRLPVIDENKRLIGMLSLGDIAAKGPSSLSAETLKAVSAHHT